MDEEIRDAHQVHRQEAHHNGGGAQGMVGGSPQRNKGDDGMRYALQIFCGPDDNAMSRLSDPISIETATRTKNEVTDNEIRMIEAAFAAQIKEILELLLNK